MLAPLAVSPLGDRHRNVDGYEHSVYLLPAAMHRDWNCSLQRSANGKSGQCQNRPLGSETGQHPRAYCGTVPDMFRSSGCASGPTFVIVFVLMKARKIVRGQAVRRGG
jgi:hypothetical protein